MIVTFSGVSGCGKTTIGKILKEKLEKEGYKVKYRVEFDYFLLKYVLKCIHFLHKEAKSKITNNILIKKKYPKIISKIWAYLVFLDFLLEYFYLNIFFRKHIIIMDRCIIDLWVGWNWTGFSDKFIEWLYLKLFPKYDIMNVLLINSEIAFNRGKDRRNSLVFYKSINEKYIFLSKLLSLKTYNSNIPEEELVEKIYQDNLAKFIKVKSKKMIYFYLAKNYTVLRRYDWVHFIGSYKKIVNKNYRVLEIGGSEKERTENLAAYCNELIMLEKFSERMPRFNPKDNIRVINGDWQNLSPVIEPESVDIICASHVIEHIKDDLRCLNESYEVLKKEGFLLFNTPNRKRLTRAVIEFFKGKRRFPYWEHKREYIKDDLEKLIKKSKFKNCNYNIEGVSFGCNGGPFVVYSDRAPKIFEKYSTFWEVLIKKNK